MFCEKRCSWACNFIKKETLAQVFSCEFCEISKNNFFTEHLWTTAPEQINKILRLGNSKTINKVTIYTEAATRGVL